MLRRISPTLLKVSIQIWSLLDFFISFLKPISSSSPSSIHNDQGRDGHLWYNAARKMSHSPFLFPHTQMATLSVDASMFLMQTMMLSKAEVWFGFVLNFLCVLLFAGLNELSKVRTVLIDHLLLNAKTLVLIVCNIFPS